MQNKAFANPEDIRLDQGLDCASKKNTNNVIYLVLCQQKKAEQDNINNYALSDILKPK